MEKLVAKMQKKNAAATGDDADADADEDVEQGGAKEPFHSMSFAEMSVED